METNTQNFESIDSHFSPKLLALMGEWVTYRAFDSKQGLADDYPLREMFEKSLLCDDTDIFGIMGQYGPTNNREYFWVASMLLKYGIVKTEAPHLRSIVSYDDVRLTFLKNIDVDGQSIFINFANTLCYEFKNNNNRGTKHQIDCFTIEVGCEPLVKAFEAEGYIVSQEKKYSWTSKIRPLFEYSGIWNHSDLGGSEEKFIQSLTNDYLKSLDLCYSKQGFYSALQMLKNHPETQSSHFISEVNKPAPHIILNILYPEENAKISELPKLKWFGETIIH